MGRPQRVDAAGMWHHAGNGGVGSRTIFESRRDARMFLSLLARAVRAGLLEVHAFVVMGTHFHLLIRSPVGEFSRAMQWIQQKYAIYFNRTRHRTDSVFGKRFFSREVKTDSHWIATVRYIDMNPVRAGLAVDPETYPYGSARHYCSAGGPRWLSKNVVSAYLGSGGACDPDRYRNLWSELASQQATEVVKRRMELCPSSHDPLDEFIRGTDGGALAWIRRLARNADGVPPATSLLSPSHSLDALTAISAQIERLEPERAAASHPLSTVLSAGILRTACGESVNAISSRLGIHRCTVERLLRRHSQSLLANDDYADLVSDFIRAQISLVFPQRQVC